MKEITIQIEDKTYNVQVVESEDEKVQGLSNTEELPLNGMLFDYSSDPQSELTFNTIDMNYPIDIIFINSNYEVTAVELGEPKSDEIIECIADEDELIIYVLETNANSGIKVGDEFEIEDEDVDDEEVNKMYIIGSDGNPQFELIGGERIFSRIHTRKLIKLAKRANKSKKDSDYKKLGKTLFNIIEIQNTQEPEYVDGPEKDVEIKKGE